MLGGPPVSPAPVKYTAVLQVHDQPATAGFELGAFLRRVETYRAGAIGSRRNAAVGCVQCPCQPGKSFVDIQILESDGRRLLRHQTVVVREIGSVTLFKQ